MTQIRWKIRFAVIQFLDTVIRSQHILPHATTGQKKNNDDCSVRISMRTKNFSWGLNLETVVTRSLNDLITSSPCKLLAFWPMKRHWDDSDPPDDYWPIYCQRPNTHLLPETQHTLFVTKQCKDRVQARFWTPPQEPFMLCCDISRLSSPRYMYW